MAKTNDYLQNYVKLAQNQQAGVNSYLNEMQDNANSLMSNNTDLKYNDTYNNYANALRQNAGLEQLGNIQSANNQLNTYTNAYNNVANQQSLALQNAQRFGQMSSLANGVGSQGYMQSANNGMYSTYANNMANANQSYADNIAQIYSDLATKNTSSNVELNNKLLELDQEYNNALATQETEKANAIKEQLNNLFENATNTEELKQGYDYYAEDENNKGYITTDMYSSFSNAYKNLANQEQENRVAQYGDNIEGDGIDISTLNISQIEGKTKGAFANDGRVRKIIASLKNGEIADGTIIDMNQGLGKNKYIKIGNKIYKYNGKGKVDVKPSEYENNNK